MYIGLHVKYRCYSCQILMKVVFPQECFNKYSNIKFHENSSSGRRVVPCGQADMTKLTVDFHDFVNAPKIRTNIAMKNYETTM
jgi:hypothetical protein